MANSSGKSRNSKSNGRRVGMILAAFIACALAAPEARAGDLHALIDPSTLSVVANTTSGNGGGTRKAIYAVNGAGMNADGTHQSDAANNKMWEAGSVSSDSPGSFKVDLGRVAHLNGIKIWNYNWSGQTGRGAKEMEIYYTDSSEIANATSKTPIGYIRSNWTKLKDSFELPQAPGKATYAGEEMITFEDVEAQWVVFVITSNWGGGNGGLSEVRFYEHVVTPVLGDVSLSRTGAATYSLTATEDTNTADLSYILSDGETVTTNGTTSVAEGGTATWTITGLTANKTYQVSVVAENSSGTDEKTVGIFYTGELSLGATTNANEDGPVSGTVAVSRAASSSFPLTLNYTISSSAAGTAEGTTWAAPAAVTIPAGETTGYLLVTPIVDTSVTEDVTVTVTLADGNYEIPASASATLDIANLTVPSGYNTWIATSDGLASVDSNWSTGIAPTSSDNVLFDGRFSTANCEWDAAATHTVATWTQTADYTGTVTFDTKYPVTGDAFQTFTVTGACVVDGGVWTHPVSVDRPNNGTALTVGQLRDAYTYRLSVAAGSFTIGSGARIDAIGKGLSQKRVSANVARLNPAHGGKSGDSTVACYGNPKYPEDIGYASNMGTDGLGKCAAGGGAVKIAVTGACVVNGVITVDGERSSGNVAAGAAGSVLIEAASVSGTGSIFARAVWCGNNSYANGVGGRIALITVDPVDTTSLTVSAGAASDIAAASGTVYLKDASMTDGVLIVRNTGRTYSNPAQGRRTDVSSDGSWKFDRVELGGDVQFAVPFGTTLTLPGWNCVSAPYNSSGTPSGIYYLGGSLDFGSSSEATLSGKWYFAPISNYVFHANVSLADGASIGFGGMYPQTLANNAYPVAVDRICCTVEGDMTVPAGCSVNVNQSGAMQDSHGVPADYPQGAHGGRRSNTMKTIGSVFHPRTLPHGQSNSYGWIIPGGAVELVVSGTLTLGGTIESTAYTGNDGTKSEVGGGSIDITAGRLEGDGSIKAGAVKDGQPGGRIAIRLTAAGATLGDFEGTVNCATMGAGSVGSCGSIYIETAADGDRRGTIILDDNNVTCTTYTPICATGYEADDVADFKKASLVIKQQAKGQVTAADAEGKFAMNSVEIDSAGQLDLFGHTLIVKSAKVNGVKLSPGTYDAGSTVEIGEGKLRDYLVDTATGGALVVTGGGFSLKVR